MTVDCTVCESSVAGWLAVWVQPDRAWNDPAASGTPYCSFDCRVDDME